MGSPLSGLIAEAVLQRLERLVLNSYPPKFWARYVDDTFVIIKRSDVQDFKALLNSIFPDIQFTMEEEVDNRLPFLDVQVTKLSDGNIKTTVYRKATNTRRILHFRSNHPVGHKRSCVRTLFQRAQTHYSDDDDGKKEVKYLRALFEANGYPKSFIRKCLRKSHSGRSNEEKPKFWLSIPYVKNVSEATSRILKPFGIGVAHKPASTIRQQIMRPKDPLPVTEQSAVVYSIPCQDCDARPASRLSGVSREARVSPGRANDTDEKSHTGRLPTFAERGEGADRKSRDRRGTLSHGRTREAANSTPEEQRSISSPSDEGEANEHADAAATTLGSELGINKLADDMASLQKQTVSPSFGSQQKPSTPHVQSSHSACSKTAATCCNHTTFSVKARRCISPCSFTFKQSKRAKPVSPNVIAANLPDSSNPGRTFYVRDTRSGRRFLVDTGVQLSVIPPTPADRRCPNPGLFLQAVNTSPIATFGTCSLSLYIGLRRLFPWIFVVADVHTAILGADFFGRF
ncbi:hypothetical protein SprV_0902650200 [Sparganum proliferum]